MDGRFAIVWMPEKDRSTDWISVAAAATSDAPGFTFNGEWTEACCRTEKPRVIRDSAQSPKRDVIRLPNSLPPTLNFDWRNVGNHNASCLKIELSQFDFRETWAAMIRPRSTDGRA
jgi:hypothetical protein